MAAIQTLGLTKHYRAWRRLPFRPARPTAIAAVDSLDISVHDGEVFGFLGPNGAGKSTTIRLLLGFLHTSAGYGRVLGLDIVRESGAIRRRTGYLPSGIALYARVRRVGLSACPANGNRSYPLRPSGPRCFLTCVRSHRA